MSEKYTLSHNMGEISFQTLKDAIFAMYLVADYDKDCEAEFTRTQTEIDRITKKVEQRGYYKNEFFTLYISE